MKRPLAAAGFSFGIGCAAAAFSGMKIALVLCVLCSVGFILSLFIRRFRSALNCTVLLFVLLGLFSGGIFTASLQTPNGLEIQNAQFTAETRVSSSRFIGTLELESCQSLTAAVISSELERFEVCRVSGVLEEIGDEYKNYYLSKGCTVQIYPAEIESAKLTGGSDILRLSSAINSACSQKLYEYLPQKQASIADAVLLGNTYAMNSEVYENFRISGVSHLAVVSGMHLSIISAVIFSLLYFGAKRRRLAAVVSLIAVFLFMLVTGFTLSIVRAGIMSIITLSGSLFARRGDSANNLGGAVLLILLINPASIYDAGFQLSVFSTLGIITLAPCMSSSCAKYFTGRLGGLIFKLIINPIIITIAAFLTTAPILIINFSYIGTYFIITNLLLDLTTSIMMCSAAVLIIFSFIPFCGFVTYPMALVTGLLADFTEGVVKFFSSLPYAELEIELPYASLIVGILTLIVAVVWLARRKATDVIKASCCCIVAFSLILAIFTAVVSRDSKLRLISTGEGICAVLEKNGESAVISCGGYSNRYKLQNALEEYEQSNLITVKGGTPESGGLFHIVSSACNAERFYLQATNTNSKTAESISSAPVTLYSEPESIRLWNSVTLNLIPIQNSTAVVLELEAEYILILPNPELAAYLPEGFRSPSLLITTEATNGGAINADKTIICCNGESDAENTANGLYSAEVFSLYQSGEIDINLSDKIRYIKEGE